MTFKSPEDLIGENGLLKELPTLLGERVLDAEQAEHLGREYHEVVADAGGNIRNGMDKKTHKGRFGGQRAHQDGAVGAQIREWFGLPQQQAHKDALEPFEARLREFERRAA